MSDKKWMEIPAPKFNQWENVWLLHGGNMIPHQVVSRLYDPDSGVWFYKLDDCKGWSREEDLGSRADNALDLKAE